MKDPGTTAPTGPRPLPPAGTAASVEAAGAGPRSCDMVNRCPVLLSNVIAGRHSSWSGSAQPRMSSGLFLLRSSSFRFPDC